MAGQLRELFGTVTLKAGEGLKQLKKFNDLLDDSQEELGDTEKKTAKLGKELGRLGKNAARGGKAVAKGVAIGTGALVAGTAAVFAFTKAWAEGADEIGKTASKIGIGAAALQELRFAAELSGANANAVGSAIQKLQVLTFDAATKGVGPFADAMDALGLNLEEVAAMNVEDRFEFLVGELSKIEDETTRAALAVKVFGKAGTELGDLIRNGAEGVAAGRQELRELGFVLDEEALGAAAKFNDTLSRQSAIFRSFTSFIAGKTTPALTKYLVKFNKLIVANREVIQQRVEKAFELVARFLEEGLPLLGDTVEMTATLIENLGGIDSAIRAAVEAWALFKLAAMAATGPIGAVAAAVGAIVIGMMRLERNARKRREREVARDERLRNPESVIAGLSHEQLARQSGLDLLDAEAAQRKAAADLKELQTQQQLFEESAEHGRRGSKISTGFLGVSNLDQQLAHTSEGLELRDRTLELKAAQKIAEDAQAKAAKKREIFDADLAKAESEQSEAEHAETQKSLADILANLEKASGGGTGGKAKAKAEDEGKPATLQEQLEAAFRGEAIPTTGPLQPSSLGATINNVDNRIIVNVGGITQEQTFNGQSSAREVATEAAELAMGPLRDQIEEAYNTQRSVFVR